MNILYKKGNIENREIFEHICDAEEDLNNIPLSQINLGSLAYIIDTGNLYIANSKKEWKVV